jgi:hypothetical protein
MKTILLILVFSIFSFLQAKALNSKIINIDKIVGNVIFLKSDSCFDMNLDALEIKDLSKTKNLKIFAEVEFNDKSKDTIQNDQGTIKFKRGIRTISNLSIYFFVKNKKLRINLNGANSSEKYSFKCIGEMPNKMEFLKSLYNDNYFFIPDYQYDSLKKYQLKTNNKVPNGQDLISLNIKEGSSDIRFFKGNNGKIENFFPKVDSYVTLKVYSEIGDSIAITNNFANSHLENQEKFVSLLGVAPDSIMKNIGKKGEGVAGAGAQGSTKISIKNGDSIDINSALIAELKIYLSFISRVQPSKKQWLNDVLYIKASICNAYKIKDFSLDSLETKTKSKIITQQLKAILSYNAPLYVSTLPKQIENKDVLSFNVKVYDKNREIQAATYNYYIKNGFKIDFSTGIDFHTLSDMSLSIRDLTDFDGTKYKMIVPEPTNFLTPGACVLAHFYSRQHNFTNVALTTGFEVATDSKLKYLAGLSFIWGREQRLVSSAGVILGQMKTISSKYRLYRPYLSTDFGDLTVNQLLTDQYKVGFFLSFSYNLGK